MDHKEIKRLIQMVEEANISHLSLEQEDLKIEIKKEFQPQQTQQSIQIQQPTPLPTPQNTAPSPTEQTAPETAQNKNLTEIKAQMVGTFYSASTPESPPFVKIGDTIKKGSTLCIIEAMKLFNEIESDIDGTIEEICVKNGDPIEFGKTLFLVKEH